MLYLQIELVKLALLNLHHFVVHPFQKVTGSSG